MFTVASHDLVVDVCEVTLNSTAIVVITDVQLTLSRVIVRWSWMGTGTSALHFIDGSHTCLYYYRPIQHIAVPWVIQFNTYTLIVTHTH